MEWIADSSIWAGLVTLVVIELVLGIDDSVFIAILAEKLPPVQRDRARITGLLPAMVMRLPLPAPTSWPVILAKSLIVFHDFNFSARDLTMLFGGLFLPFKATVKLNERLEGKDSNNPTQRRGAKFWAVVAQIVVLDTIFSLDLVITAVSMVDYLAVMMAAAVITINLMLIASKALMRSVNSHPTIVILCLSFLLMIGFSLIAEGFSFIILKGYLCTTIDFSAMIEVLNQLVPPNRRRFLSVNMTLRQRIAEAVMSLPGGQKEKAELGADTASLVADQDRYPPFNSQERLMIERVLNLNQCSVSSITTSRHDIGRISFSAPEEEIRSLVERNQRTRLVVTGGKDNEDLLGVAYVIDLLQQSLCQEPPDLQVLVRQPLVFPEGSPLLSVFEQSHQARTHFAFVVDEFGSIEGIVTLSDVMGTIAGNLSNEVEEIGVRHGIQYHQDGPWTVDGHIPSEDLVQCTPLPLDDKREHHIVTGLLMEYLQHVLQVGEIIEIDGYTLRTLQVDSHRVQKVQIVPSVKRDELDYEV